MRVPLSRATGTGQCSLIGRRGRAGSAPRFIRDTVDACNALTVSWNTLMQRGVKWGCKPHILPCWSAERQQ